MMAAPRAASSPRILLSFDFGTRRVGVASGNTVTRTATPLATLMAHCPPGTVHATALFVRPPGMPAGAVPVRGEEEVAGREHAVTAVADKET